LKQPHILCEPSDISEYVILAGDPDRIRRLTHFLDSYEEIAYNREFITIKGNYKGMTITATSTGIGGPSAAIAIEELISCGAKYMIRIGSSGAVQGNIKIGDIVVCTGAVREDGASSMYITPNYPAVPDIKLTNLILNICEEKGYPYHYGLVRSHDSFYIEDEDKLMDHWNKKNILGSDMETSILFVLASLRGIKAASILNTVVEYKSDVKEGIDNYVNNDNDAAEGEKREILLALETFYKIHNKI